MNSSLITTWTDPRAKKSHEYVSLPELPAEAPLNLALDRSREPAGDLGCRFGGTALMPIGEPWPLAPDGRPLSLICQIDFAEVAALGPVPLPLPDAGVFSFFYDAARQPWGHKREHERSWRAFYVEKTERAIRRPSPHDRPAQRIRPRIGDTARHSPSHRIGGEGIWLQGDPRARIALLVEADIEETVSAVRAAEARGVDVAEVAMRGAAWRTLLQIASDEYEWGDSGWLYVFIREEDLRARRFDRIWVDLQCS